MAGDLEQDNWKSKLKTKFPHYFSNTLVLDIGSADINGSNRPWFKGCDYTGIDVSPYKNVDIVTIAHQYEAPDNFYDVVLSTNHLEHDLYWKKTLQKMLKLLKPGGLMFFQTVHQRPEHGTKTQGPSDSLTSALDNEEWANFYKQFTIEELGAVLKFSENFSTHDISYQPEDKRDIYFWGIKKTD